MKLLKKFALAAAAIAVAVAYSSCETTSGGKDKSRHGAGHHGGTHGAGF